ncbi:type II toxin-antitoxin system Phd/YefM family antitoxin [Nocardioides humilatus]|uniref:Antitoxin n=2 Tax=Nocardioides humilatus TaxID=2607660 RepID=A0A5B1LJB4_9ACTN|nr:type II toxin-antitoxin system Phd/YefM family antitoxin [Nocardioides humilatus]
MTTLTRSGYRVGTVPTQELDVTTMTSREFNRDVSAAKRAAADGPVVITDKGRPSHVLLSVTDYERLTGRAGRMAERLAASEAGDLPLARRTVSERPVDL